MLYASGFNIVVPLPGTTEVVLVNGMSGAIDLVAGAFGDLLTPSEDGSDGECSALFPADAARYLISRGYLTSLNRVAERADWRLKASACEASEQRRPRKFYLMPSYECQLRCGYCFEHEVRSRGRREGWGKTQIEPALVEAAFSAMDRITGGSASSRQCTLFGGEALMDENRVAIDGIVSIAGDRGYSLMAATNAFDLHHFADLLGPGKIAGIHVPIDGTESTHDRQRLGKGGAPTFHRIIENIRLALDLGVRVRLRVNVNAGALTELDAIADLLEAKGFLDHPRFSSYAKAIFATKTGSSHTQSKQKNK